MQGDERLGVVWRGVLALGAAANLVLAVGFATQRSWAVQLWPWETGRLSHLFIGAMLAAISGGAAWIAASGESASLPAGFLNLAVALGGIGAYLLLAVPGHGALGAGVLGVAVVNALLALATWGRGRVGGQPVPRIVRASNLVFALVLLAVGLALILGVEGVMPWPVDPPTSVVFGWIFCGDAFYFALAVARPHWEAARAQLWSFLAYDAVLLLPLAGHLLDVEAALLPNLLVYLAVLVYSAVLGLWFLVLNPRTRGWGVWSSEELVSG